nr:rho GDP-dissociation inhibitor 1-like [Ipomoea batatas]
MLLLHLHPCISLQKHPIFSPPSFFFNSHNKASVSAFGVGRWEALKKSRRRGQEPPLRAAEKDSDYEVGPDKAREALRKLDEQLQSLAQKKPDPPPPKIRASDVNGAPSQMTHVPEAKEITSSDLPAVDGPEDIAPEITSVLETQQDSSPFQGTNGEYVKAGLAELEHWCYTATDEDDESLRRWKEQLLGSVDVIASAEAQEPDVKILSLTIISTDRPDIVLQMPESGSPKGLWFTLKEGSKYRLRFEIKVSNEIVCGLRYINTVWKTGLKVDGSKEMLGTFSPQAEPYTHEMPEETTPSGMFARGTYSARTKFIDDDKKCYLDINYTFDIQKDWATTS